MTTEFANILKGDHAPWFTCASSSNPSFNFHTAAGRYLILGFFHSSATPFGATTAGLLEQHRELFDDMRISFFGVSNDTRDLVENRLQAQLPGIRYFWDFDGAVARAYGALPLDVQSGNKVGFRPLWIILDPSLRVIEVIRMNGDGSELGVLITLIKALPPVDRYLGCDVQAPILFLPNVFEVELCQHLVSLYEAHGGTESGFMQTQGEKTILALDPRHKRRKDFIIQDEALRVRLQERIVRRVKKEIQKVHQFEVTRMERYLVGCYAAEDGGHFQPHRDNTTRGTAHRRFAVSINLNESFEGGEVSFPEYGPRGFKAPIGGAVVFSCSLLHAVSEVTKGKRYAFLPFLYDDAAALIREANNRFLDPAVGNYVSRRT